jgi:hypothetical protein
MEKERRNRHISIGRKEEEKFVDHAEDESD